MSIFEEVCTPHKKYNSAEISFTLFSFLFLSLSIIPLFSFAQASIITYTYDEGINGIGRVSSVSDTTGSTSVVYDQRGHSIQTTQVTEGNSFVVQKTYDSRNRIISVTYPDGEVLTYSYNAASQIQSVGTYVTNIQYDAYGRRINMVMGNGTTTTLGYDAFTNRLDQLTTTSPLGSNLQDLNYTYDSLGNILSINDDVIIANDQSFVYDHLNRLQTAIGPYGNQNYAYDVIDNLICNSQISTCSQSSPNYTYPISGAGSIRPHAVTTAGGDSFQYDANGSMQSGSGRSFNYDSNNRPTSISQGSNSTDLLYDHGGNRVKKTSAGQSVYYVGQIFEKSATDSSNFIFVGSRRIAIKHSNGTIFYYHANHLGSTHRVSDSAGNGVEDIQYYPFGSSLSDTGIENVDHKYTSQEFDSSTGLYYYKARYYDPVLGRFTQADTIVPDLTNPQDFNRYSYVQNNPVNLIDPSGHFSDSFGSCSGGNCGGGLSFSGACSGGNCSGGGNTGGGGGRNGGGFPDPSISDPPAWSMPEGLDIPMGPPPEAFSHPLSRLAFFTSTTDTTNCITCEPGAFLVSPVTETVQRSGNQLYANFVYRNYVENGYLSEEDVRGITGDPSRYWDGMQTTRYDVMWSGRSFSVDLRQNTIFEDVSRYWDEISATGCLALVCGTLSNLAPPNIEIVPSLDAIGSFNLRVGESGGSPGVAFPGPPLVGGRIGPDEFSIGLNVNPIPFP